MFEKLFSLEGRVALVTGGSKGIGRMIAEGFLAQGAKVYITARKADQCVAAAEEMSKGGRSCTAIPGDISTLEGVKALADTIMQLEDHLDILVNNAGTIWMAPIESYPEKGWDKVMDLNVKSPFFLVQALLGHLKAGAKPGQPAKVINITSIDGITVNSVDTFAYQASKAAFAHLTKRLAADLIKHNIVVSALAPGAFASDLNTIARDHGEMVAAAIPAKRVGTTEDMAGTAIYLASRAGDYMVGEAVIIDGGLTAIGRGQG